ncbi:HPF/RaiA family ribosome-associated protein [Caldimonas tepidiphila]|uniref:HPF/RaiA family ribosome-associated protein n=1 Tax=Caldimonas tepidiphila TaxID=2315841 RepID=UPI000E5A30D4|nr:HPF/RaiA family ribosome-associated protein [Caldimonas tepidiphila]
MQIQLNTDNNIVGRDELAGRVEASVGDALGRFSDQITRVEVHLGDVNSHKGGGDDIRCMIEARLAGHDPVAVTHQAADIELALNGAIGKVRRALDTVVGKQNDHQAAAKRDQSGLPGI